MSTRPQPSLGRTLMPAVMLTTAAAGLVALLDRPSSSAATSAADAAPDTGAPAVEPGVTQPPEVSSTVPAAAAPAPTVAPLVAGSHAGTTVPKPPTAQTSPPAAAGGCGSGKTVDGKTVNTKWGPVQVEAVVTAQGKICDVTAIQSPNSHNKSVRINKVALPILHKQVLSVQSASIDGVSGATITSRGYERSLQSILDGLGG